ncbi:MAG: hypothetical protein WBD58_01110 [Geitlerinemataceae cyanobacterium]
MSKWIIFRSDKGQPGSLERSFSHTGSLTKILGEHFSYSDREIPEVGYRPPIFIQLEEARDPQFPKGKTHWKPGNWEVVRVDIYTPEIPTPQGGDYDEIVVCTCRYNPIDAPLKLMPERQVSIESFDGERLAYDRWLDSQNQSAQV